MKKNNANELSREEFTLAEMYKYEDYLKELHQDNAHVKDKIRQQLQSRDNRNHKIRRARKILIRQR